MASFEMLQQPQTYHPPAKLVMTQVDLDTISLSVFRLVACSHELFAHKFSARRRQCLHAPELVLTCIRTNSHNHPQASGHTTGLKLRRRKLEPDTLSRNQELAAAKLEWR